MTVPPLDDRQRLSEVARVFLRLGFTAFGGPAAHIAMMDQEIVQRRGWVDRQTFLDLLAATNLIPGPNSTEMAIHLGYHRAGLKGLIAAGVCFILPAMLIVMGLAWFYRQHGGLPQVEWALWGVKPMVLAVVAHALWALGRTALRGWPTAVTAAAVAAGSVLGYGEVTLLAAAGVAVAATRVGPLAGGGAALALFGQAAAGTPGASAAAAPTLAQLTLFFLKVGSVLYGSGYVLLAFLQADLVDRWGWLSSAELLDAVAVGQFTPGPLFTTATFVGYLLAGLPGAALATGGIFLPSFLFVWALTPLVPRMRRSKILASFLDGVVAGSLALMAVVTWHLGRAALPDPWTWALALGGGAALWRWRIHSAWLVAAGGAAGWLKYLAG